MNDEPKITELDFGIIGIPKRWSFGDKLIEIEKDCGELEPIMKCKITGYLIRFEGKTVLLDTGLHLDVIKNPVQSLGSDIYKDFPVFCEESNYLMNQIEAQGNSMKNINYVLISHMHFDHAGALEALLNSKLIAAPETISLIMQNKTNKLVDKNGNQIIYGPYQQSLKDNNKTIAIKHPYFDLFNDGRFIIFRTDGHVQGHLSVVIFTYRDISKKRFDHEIYAYLNAATKIPIKSIESFKNFKENISKCDIFPFDAVFSNIHYQYEAISKTSCWNLESATKSLKLIKKLGNLPNSKIYFPHPLC